MTASPVNRIQILYNAQHPPYLYGAVHIVGGSLQNQWWEKPFVVSKKMSNGEEIVYGTVKAILKKISSQFDRLEKFNIETQAALEIKGVEPVITTSNTSTLPESEITSQILDEQDRLIEEILSMISVNIRILSEIFPNKLKAYKVDVYDYDGGQVGSIELSKVTDLLVHNRYMVIRDTRIVDLFSDENFMAGQPQMGLQIDFNEYLDEVQKAIGGLTVKDLISRLWGITKKISTSSNIRDIIFLTQNLYALGESLVGTEPIHSGPLKTILDRVASKHLDAMYPKSQELKSIEAIVTVTFTTPSFYLEPDIDSKQIRIQTQVNGQTETLVMDYEDFFSELSQASGSRKLYTRPVS